MPKLVKKAAAKEETPKKAAPAKTVAAKSAEKKPVEKTPVKQKAAAPVKEKAEKKVEIKHTFPERIPSKTLPVTYVRLDDLTYTQLAEKVANGINYPIRMLMRESREDKKVTEFAVCHVGKQLVTCIDLNSTGDMQDSGFRFNAKELSAREAAGFPFDLFEIVPNEEDKPAAQPAKKTISNKK